MQNVISVALVCALLAGATRAAAAQSPVERGQQVFTAQKCAMCHAVAGKGNAKGVLDDVGARLSADEIRQWIVNAPEMAAKARAERKPAMKVYGTLAKDEIDGLVAFLSSLKK